MNEEGGGKLRFDQKAILEIVPEGSPVLDLYCGRGELLAALAKERAVRGQGIEIDEDAIFEEIAL